MNKPTLVFHADWSSIPSKRWCAKATLGSDGHYSAFAPRLVGDLRNLFESLKADAGKSGIVFAGFDFPIGLSEHYARRTGITSFRKTLPELGTGRWKDFFRVCDEPHEVSVFRPFYPNQGRKGSSWQHLLEGHNAADMRALLRRCELGGDGRKQACSLFWTLGGNQVGKAAIAGWRDVLVPTLNGKPIRLWPFDGKLESLLQPGKTVVAETYPAECYGWFPGEPLRSKTDADSRKRFGKNLLSWARDSHVNIDPALKNAINDGFPAGGDDAFDAVVGLVGMLQVCLGERQSGETNDAVIRNVEGWILGRQPLRTAPPKSLYSAATDPDLHDWLRWASESGEAPSFVRAIAEAASIADLENYALLRPLLLHLRRRNSSTHAQFLERLGKDAQRYALRHDAPQRRGASRVSAPITDACRSSKRQRAWQVGEGR